MWLLIVFLSLGALSLLMAFSFKSGNSRNTTSTPPMSLCASSRYKYDVEKSHWAGCFTASDDRESLQDCAASFSSYIANARYYLPQADNMLLAFKGYAVYDQENKHNPKAVAILDYEGKMWGYIPDSDLGFYHRESKPIFACVGYVSIFGDSLRSNVKIILSEDDVQISKAANAYIDWFKTEFGQDAIVREPKSKETDSAGSANS